MRHGFSTLDNVQEPTRYFRPRCGQAGFPAGVLNVVHGAKEAVNAILDHPLIAAVSFVGSERVARYVYERGAKNGKRVF